LWLVPVIPATQEAEIGKIAVPDHPGQKVCETPSQTIFGHGGACLSSQFYRKIK
jgi:hypothetical protein